MFLDILKSIQNSPNGIDTLVTRDTIIDEPDYEDWIRPYKLGQLWSHPFVHQLRQLHSNCSHLNYPEWLAAVTPLETLAEFHGDADMGPGPAQEQLTLLVRLMPNLRTLHLQFQEGVVYTLQPLLQLPSLQRLTIDTCYDGCYNMDGGQFTAHHVFGTSTPRCKLRYMKLIGSERLHILLVYCETKGLRNICADTVEHLVLYNMEHRNYFADHLAQFQQLRYLELLAPVGQLYAISKHRQYLLAALKQLTNLTTLKLHVETEERYGHKALYREACQPWSAVDLVVLLCLPLQHLVVQHLEPSAGQALKAIADMKNLTLRTLKLGVTELDWHVVSTAAGRLDELILPDSVRPGPGKRRRLRSEPLLTSWRPIPPSITFYQPVGR